jgi:hypothetical protein
MGRKPKFIEGITEEQRGSLQRGYSRRGSPIFRQECHCTLQNSSGKQSTLAGTIVVHSCLSFDVDYSGHPAILASKTSLGPA